MNNTKLKNTKTRSDVSVPSILVDSREPADFVKELCKKLAFPVFQETLPLGDILVGEYLIERKTAYDFYQSYIDGRLHNQLQRMQSDSNGFTPVLLIEGQWNAVVGKLRALAKIKQRKFNWVTQKQALLTMYKKTILFNDVKHFHTKDQQETCELIQNLAIETPHDQQTVRAVRHASKKHLTLDEWQRGVLESLPGIGPKKSDLSLKRCTSLVEVLFMFTHLEPDGWDLPLSENQRQQIHHILYHKYGTEE